MIRHLVSRIGGRGRSRHFVSEIKNLGQNLGVEGSVFTENDGSIKIVAEGPEENLMVFSQKLPKINLFDSVELFHTRWLDQSTNCMNF